MNNFADFLDGYSKKNTNYNDIVELIRVNDIDYKKILNCSNNALFSYKIPTRYKGTKKEKTYDVWSKTHEIKDFPIHEPIQTAFIDCSVNSLSDLIDITNRHIYDKNIQYNINLKALHDIKLELISLNSMIGMRELKDNIVDQLLYFLQNMHIHNNNSDYKHTVLYGPPGTGKTEVAEIIGRIFSKIGILKKNIFRKVTRSDLIAGYVGQTELKTTDVINSCLGGCLFIDEVYSLGTDESFSKVCIDTINEALSRHKNNLMVIIAGYEDEIKRCFFSVNSGLESRFIWTYRIEPYNSSELFQIFRKKTTDIDWVLDDSIDAKWFDKHKDMFQYYGRDIENFLTNVKVSHSRRVFGKTEDRKRIHLADLQNGLQRFTKNRKKTPVFHHYI